MKLLENVLSIQPFCPDCTVDEPCERCEERYSMALPPSPLCERCGHQLVPFSDEMECEEGEECDCCVQYFCWVPDADFERWHDELNRVNDDWPHPVQVTTTAYGPWLPERIRREREDRAVDLSLSSPTRDRCAACRESYRVGGRIAHVRIDADYHRWDGEALDRYEWENLDAWICARCAAPLELICQVISDNLKRAREESN